MLLTFIAEEGKRVCTTSVIQGLLDGVIQYTVSIFIWLRILPISEGTVTVVWPFPRIAEQTDPKKGQRWFMFINFLLYSLIFSLAPHTGQVFTMQLTVCIGFPPRHLCENDIRSTGPFICKYWKMYYITLKCLEKNEEKVAYTVPVSACAWRCIKEMGFKVIYSDLNWTFVMLRSRRDRF